MHVRLPVLPLALLLASCTATPTTDAPPAPTTLRSATPALAAAPPPAPSPVDPHPRLDGRSFPDKVIALTWDDGPDANTLELASYLRSRHISATFFVVGSWVNGLSDDPGDGKGVFQSGYEFLPILGDLVELRHRIGNHTLNHVILREAAGAQVLDNELRENQQNIDPFLTNELRLFRVPGGGWGPFAANIVASSAYLTRMVGPVMWDVDRKDWDESLSCRGPSGAFECEHAAPGGALRMKASVVAARYVASIERSGHGIVLLHDRVGDVGSTYGFDIARAMIPQLEAHGFVFAAPVLHFSELLVRHHEDPVSETHRWQPTSLRLGDVNGDGRADVCGRDPLGVSCAVSVQSALTVEDHLPRTMFRGVSRPASASTADAASVPAGTIHLADVSGDGQVDVCVGGPRGIACATSNVVGELSAFRTWSEDDHSAAMRFADVDGDGRADACRRSASGIACARNIAAPSRERGASKTARRFEPARTWLADMTDEGGWADPRFALAVQLADVDGDGRADVCGRGPSGVVCALSNGRSFGKVEKWSVGGDFAEGEIRFGDLNGDGREDVCGAGPNGVVCALSTARGFTRATEWLGADAVRAQGFDRPELAASIQLGDVNGDGRADLCGRGTDGVACALAP